MQAGALEVSLILTDAGMEQEEWDTARILCHTLFLKPLVLVTGIDGTMELCCHSEQQFLCSYATKPHTLQASTAEIIAKDETLQSAGLSAYFLQKRVNVLVLLSYSMTRCLTGWA